MNRSLTVAAWLAALALVVIAGAAAFATFFDTSRVDNPSSWVEYEACLHSNGYVAQGDDPANALAKEVCDGEL